MDDRWGKTWYEKFGVVVILVIALAVFIPLMIWFVIATDPDSASNLQHIRYLLNRISGS